MEPVDSSLSYLCLSLDILASFDGVLASFFFPEDPGFPPLINSFLVCSSNITLSC
jgi:hypothetical protein